MSIDVRLKDKYNEEFKMTLDVLKDHLEDDFTVVDSNVDEEGFVTFFQVEPKDKENPEKIVFEFHLQADGRLWHPVYTRTSEGGELDSYVVNMIEINLDMEVEDD